MDKRFGIRVIKQKDGKFIVENYTQYGPFADEEEAKEFADDLNSLN